MTTFDFEGTSTSPTEYPPLKSIADLTADELEELYDSAPKFGDKRDRRRTAKKRFVSGRIERAKRYISREKKMARKPQGQLQRPIVDRDDPVLRLELEADPIKFIQQEFSRALISEVMINRELYSHEEIDALQVTASNKRMVELADAMKTLPKQNDGARGKNQKSAAELIEDAIEKHDPTAAEKTRQDVEEQALKRAHAAFDEEE